ncbi:MAG: 4Fe-4S binding protein [Syntrophales bacterium]
MGSRDAFAVDSAVCRMLRLDAERLPTLKAAMEMGIRETDVEIDGDLPVIYDFRLPNISPLMYGPRKLHGFIRRHLLQRPASHDLTCQMCGECWKICPAGAISSREKKLSFDYDRCIRCFCCIEVCPYGAIHTKETFPGRIIKKVVARHF